MMNTKTINLRDLPEDLVRRAKAYAALSGTTLKDFVIHAIEKAVEAEIRPKPLSAAFARRTRKTKGKVHEK